MTLNCTAPGSGKQALRRALKALGYHSEGELRKRVWLTTVSTAASVDGTGLDAVMLTGDLVLNTTTLTEVFVCTVVPSGDAGTFVKMVA
jgi:hypothetical protein